MESAPRTESRRPGIDGCLREVYRTKLPSNPWEAVGMLLHTKPTDPVFEGEASRNSGDCSET